MGTVIRGDKGNGTTPGGRLLRTQHLIGVLTAVLVVAGLVTLGATPFSTGTASTPPLAVKQVWSHYLDDAPCGVALASPAEVNLDTSGPSVEIGDREGDLYAFHLSNGSVPAAWAGAPASASVGSGQGCGIAGNDRATAKPALGTNGIAVPGNPPIDSTASVGSTPYGSFIYFGAGNAADPGVGGYYAYGPNGHPVWSRVVNNPSTDPLHDIGIQASPTLVTTNVTPFVTAGSLGQESDALAAVTGGTVSGWPYFSADSVFSTAAVADLYGTGQDELVVGGASTEGVAYGRHYLNGGHLRILNDHGGLICAANTNEEIDSSPAIGPILPGDALGIATGTGSYYSGTDENSVKVFDTHCNEVWSKTLDGTTGGSPALADLRGNGQLDVVEGTSTNDRSGSVWALDASTGAVLWKVPALGAVLGSVTTAALGSNGAQDVIVGTTAGLEILDGKTGEELVHVDDGSGDGGVTPGTTFGFQNAPLVTDDPNGLIGITVAGYEAVTGSPDHDVQGVVQHFTVPESDGALVAEAGGWPQFHHDAHLTGFTGAPTTQASGCQTPPAALNGYLAVAADGGVFSFGGQQFCGSAGAVPLKGQVVGVGTSPDQGGYWLVASDGGVFAYGVPFYGSAAGLHMNSPIVGMAATPDGRGYWLVARDGGVFAFGDAPYYGSGTSVPNADVVAMAPSPDGGGYWEVTADGTVWAFGDASFSGDASHLALTAPIVGITADPATGGYWLVAANGDVFSFNAPFLGSIGSLPLARPAVGMVATNDGNGYWLIAADGGVFAYGDASYEGSENGKPLNQPVVAIAGY